MKNIHIIPTDKPSKLWFNLKGKLVVDTVNCLYEDIQCQNIYITNDEEINQQTKPCWCINTIKNTWDADLIYYQGSMPQYHYVGFKKIILTTDQDLIKDGVQAIDDEFLKWFVKNPSCKEVEVAKTNKLIDLYADKEEDKWEVKYHIYIPKEEPKNICIQTGLPCGMQCLSEDTCNRTKSKQETLEEAAERYVNSFEFGIAHPRRVCKNAFINGAKWQQERSYSEEEVEEIVAKLMHEVHNGDITYGDYVIDFKLSPRQWFEQFKKK